MANNILASISTELADRQYIEIDGIRYGIRQAAEFELRDLERLQLFDEKIRSGTLSTESDEDQATLNTMLDLCCKMVLIDCPDEVHAKLQPVHRKAIIVSFSRAASAPSAVPTSTRPSRRSRGSTAVASMNGSA